MSGFFADNDEFRVELEGRVAFDTNLPSVVLLPDAKIVTTQTITFPNLVSTIMYFQRTAGGGGATACESWSALLWQEHGPDRVDASPQTTSSPANPLLITRYLAPTSLGSIPSDANYLDVRARLRRTTTPPTFGRTAPPYIFHPENEWINLPGGSCICEYFSPLSRMFNVVLDGQEVLLNRYQSVADSGVVSEYTGGNLDNATATQVGSQWGNYTRAPAGRAGFAVNFDVKGYDTNGNKRPGWGTTSTNSCSDGSVINYTSVYSVDLEITPGRYRP